MGFNITLIAVDKTDVDKTLDLLGLQKTETLDEYNESPYSGALTDNNQFVIWQNTSQMEFSETKLKKLGQNVNCLIMGTYDVVMSGFVRRVKNAKIEWEIIYNGCDDPKDFFADGAVPKQVLDIRKRLAEQAKEDNDDDVDYDYEILSESMALFTGLKHDMDHEFKFTQLKMINPKAAAKKPWWKLF